MSKDIFVIFIIAFIAINCEEIRILNYYHQNGLIYSIEEKDNNFKIITKEVIFCFVEPCIPPVIAEKTIENKEDIKSLNSLFDDIFINYEIKEINFVDDELTEEQKKIILKILKNNKIISILEYEIIEDDNNYNGLYRKRGYLYNSKEDSVIYTIAMGKKPTAGYSIAVKEVKIEGESVTIYVTEKSPGKDDMVDDVITYPIVKVKFNKLPSSIEVLNYDTRESFPSLN